MMYFGGILVLDVEAVNHSQHCQIIKLFNENPETTAQVCCYNSQSRSGYVTERKVPTAGNVQNRRHVTYRSTRKIAFREDDCLGELRS